MKTRYILFLLILTILSCNQFDKKTESLKENNDAIEYILNPDHFIGKKAIGVYLIKDIYLNNDIKIVQLKKAGLINDKTKVYFSSSQCISLVTRMKEDMGGGFVDFVISNNLNESDFLCGLNNIYNLNQNENITQLKIKVKESFSLLTLAIIEGD